MWDSKTRTPRYLPNTLHSTSVHSFSHRLIGTYASPALIHPRSHKGCGIGPSGASALFSALAASTSLTTLGLRGMFPRACCSLCPTVKRGREGILAEFWWLMVFYSLSRTHVLSPLLVVSPTHTSSCSVVFQRTTSGVKVRLIHRENSFASTTVGFGTTHHWNYLTWGVSFSFFLQLHLVAVYGLLVGVWPSPFSTLLSRFVL